MVVPSFADESAAPVNTFENGRLTVFVDGTVIDLSSAEYAGIKQIWVAANNVTINGNATLTPTGTATENIRENAAIFVSSGSLVINGGEYVANSGFSGNSHAAIHVQNAQVTINGGTFVGNGKDAAVRVCGEKGPASVTVNDGTFKSDWVTAFTCCDGANLNVQDGTWSSTSTYTNANGVVQQDIFNIYQKQSGANPTINVTGGTFPDAASLTVYRENADKTSTTVNAVPTGFEFDATTGTVAKEPCKHVSPLFVKEVPATAEKEGTKAHWLCSCGKKFSDQAATTEVTDLELVIPVDVNVGDTNVGDNVGNVGGEGSKEEQKDDNDDKKTSSTPAPAPAAPAATQEKDNTPKTGAISVVAIIAVMSVIGLAIIKRD